MDLAVFLIASIDKRTLFSLVWKKLPVWARVLLLVISTLFLILFIVLLVGVTWIIYVFISSGVWKTIPAEVTAAIVAGLFAVLTLTVGNFLNRQTEIESALEIKRIEQREAEGSRRNQEQVRIAEFYAEVINKLIDLISNPSAIDDTLNGFYGKLYTQGSCEVVSDFLKIVRELKFTNSDQAYVEIKVYPQANALIGKLRGKIGLESKGLELYRMVSNAEYKKGSSDKG